LKTFFGLFEYKVMTFRLQNTHHSAIIGLHVGAFTAAGQITAQTINGGISFATAPSVLQRFINHVLAPFLDIFVLAYLDDIVIFSENEKDHERAQLHLKPAKCVWSQKEISFLEFTAVAPKGIRMSDDKLEAMREWEAPKNLREVRSFPGLTNV
jgi:hypothetical protein